MDINIAIVGPLISAIIQAVKVAGVSSRYIPGLNIVTGLVVAVVYGYPEYEPVSVLVNWGVIVLATAGTYEMVGALNKKEDMQSEPRS